MMNTHTEIIKRPQTIYPKSKLKLAHAGLVKIETMIDKTGKVSDAAAN